MRNVASPESGNQTSQPAGTDNFFFDDACIQDMDCFVKTLAGIKAKGARTDLIGPMVAHYASKWLPDLSGETSNHNDRPQGNLKEQPGCVTASWMKKRLFLETIVGILPPEKDSVSCNFLLRLLRNANMLGIDPAHISELERRVSWQLDQASLKELMIPSFSHTCGTLLDVELVARLVKMFVRVDEVSKSVASLIKVSKLVDSYLAEVATDSKLGLEEFVDLSRVLPSHARATDDGLYRAIDTYLKAHLGLTKQEKKTLCGLIDCSKLSGEASRHAVQNNRLPVRCVIQVLYLEQTKFTRTMVDWSDSFTSLTSPNVAAASGLDQPSRCLSKREMTTQQFEMRRLKEELRRLQSQCYGLQAQMERVMLEKNKKKKGFFKWRILSSFCKINAQVGVHKGDQFESNNNNIGYKGRQGTPVEIRSSNRVARAKSPLKWRKSTS